MTFGREKGAKVVSIMTTSDGIDIFSKRTAERLKNFIFDLEEISNHLYNVKCDIKMCSSMARYLTNFRYLKYRANSELDINSPVKLCKEHHMFLIKNDVIDLLMTSKKETDIKKRLLIDIPFINVENESVICQRCKYEWRPVKFSQRKFLMPDSCPQCHSFTWWKVNTVKKNNKKRVKAFWNDIQ